MVITHLTEHMRPGGMLAISEAEDRIISRDPAEQSNTQRVHLFCANLVSFSDLAVEASF